MVVCERFGEISQDELQQTEGGLAIYLPTESNLAYRVSNYITNWINYGITVSYVNSYNDTVTSNGRTDLVKPYPEKPQF